jgi:DNA-directed RNA polymerase specialized sigma subunit
MVFFVKKRRSRYIKTDFDKKDFDPPHQDELPNLVQSLQNGDIESFKTLVLGHVKLGIKIAGQYPGQCDDLVSTALEAILDGCDRVREGRELKDNNITGYLISLINSRCLRMSREDRTIKVPHSSMGKAAKEGKPIVPPHLVPIKDTVSRRVFDTADLRETIMSCCESDKEIAIIKLREKSYTNVEIGELLGLTDARVGQILKGIERRFDKKEQE